MGMLERGGARRRPLIIALAVAAVLLVVSGCASSSNTTSAHGGTTVTPPTTAPRPAGPTADLSHQLTGGKGVFIGSAYPPLLAQADYVEREYEADGTASSYKVVGSQTGDGRWQFQPDQSAAYRTRVLVRAPAKQSNFSGTVVVEWLNVSGGVDADPEWTSVREEVERDGDIWVGVSAQLIGVEGGPVVVKVDVPGSEAAGKGLKKIDPVRYGHLEHPGDNYSLDIYTQVARALRTGAALDGWKPKRLIAAGESQSAFALVTYYDGVQPLTHEFDGFFVHSRGAVALPVAGTTKYAGIQDALKGTPVIFRTDQPTPIMDIQTETDVESILSSYTARQPDNPYFRLWEVAGTSHADAHLIGPGATTFNCGVPINDGPMHLVAKAAYHALDTWLETGTPPRTAPRIDVKMVGTTPTVQRDADGLALGGIRTPPVDVPVAVLSGKPGPVASAICLLSGSATPLSPARLAQLYPTRAAYVARYDADANQTIKAGFVLPQDRAALLAMADPKAVPNG
jgi:hypothetical protein